jgi:hypothetical protein
MSFRAETEYIGGNPDLDCHTKILIKNEGGASIGVGETTWHNPDRLDKMVAEINAVALKYGLLCK